MRVYSCWARKRETLSGGLYVLCQAGETNYTDMNTTGSVEIYSNIYVLYQQAVHVLNHMHVHV